jgi:hypothetical protein
MFSYSYKHPIPWDQVPASVKVAVVEQRRENRENFPDPYQSSISQFYANERKRKARIAKHVNAILKLRNQ